MRMKSSNMKAVLIILSILLMPYPTSAQELPKGVQVMVDYAVQQAQELTFLAAYLGGILTFLSPCVLPLFLIFLSISFQEKRNLVKMTFILFLGLATVYALFGLGVFYLSDSLKEFREIITPLAGGLLILMGVSVAFGRGFTLIKPPKNMRFGLLGVYSLGVFFAIGFTPCVGPIYAGILFLSSFLQSPFYSAALMVFYAAGVVTPLVAIAAFWNRMDFSRLKIRGMEITVPLYGRKIRFHPVSLAAGIILVGIGVIFLLYSGTYIFNFFDPVGTKKYFYMAQGYLLDNPVNKTASSLFAIVSAAAIVYLMVKLKAKKHKQV